MSWITSQRPSPRWTLGTILGVGCAVFMGITLRAPTAFADETSSPAQVQLQEQMKAKGTDASLTILPVRVGGRPFDRVSEALGVLLEQQGLKNIELGTKAYDPAADADLLQLADGLGKFVTENPITTDYALYVEYNANLPQLKLESVRGAIVDKQGAVVISRQTTPEELEKLQQGDHPDLMTISVGVAEQIGPHFGLNEQTAAAAKPGKMAQLMEERSGIPTESERNAVIARAEAMRKAGPARTLLVLTPRVMGKATQVDSAAALASQINEAKLCVATAALEVTEFHASQRDPNELKALWEFAREVREHVRQHPPETDYVLAADFVFTPMNWERGFVHFVVCDAHGEWVLVDLQNSHHKAYQSIRPVSQDDCDRLLVKRLAGELKQ